MESILYKVSYKEKNIMSMLNSYLDLLIWHFTLSGFNTKQDYL